MVLQLGGPADFIERMEAYLPQAPVTLAVVAEEAGFVEAIATRDIGLAVVELGGGRRSPQDRIDAAVGLTRLAPISSRVEKGDPLALVHARSQEAAQAAASAVRAAYRISDARVRPGKAVLRRITISD
jgi:thymidine phosphorylase